MFQNNSGMITSVFKQWTGPNRCIMTQKWAVFYWESLCNLVYFKEVTCFYLFILRTPLLPVERGQFCLGRVNTKYKIIQPFLLLDWLLYTKIVVWNLHLLQILHPEFSSSIFGKKIKILALYRRNITFASFDMWLIFFWNFWQLFLHFKQLFYRI